jgi:hypothetical protein
MSAGVYTYSACGQSWTVRPGERHDAAWSAMQEAARGCARI